MRRKEIVLSELSDDELLTSYQVAQALGVDPSSVGLWVQAGRLRGFRTPGGHLRIKADDLKRFCADSGMDAGEDSQSVSTYTAARMLGVSPSSVVTWIRQEMLQAWKTPGGHNRIRVSELKEFARRFNMHVSMDKLKAESAPLEA